MAKEQISSSGFIYVLVRIILVNVTVSPKKKNSKNQWLNTPLTPSPQSFISHLPRQQTRYQINKQGGNHRLWHESY